MLETPSHMFTLVCLPKDRNRNVSGLLFHSTDLQESLGTPEILSELANDPLFISLFNVGAVIHHNNGYAGLNELLVEVADQANNFDTGDWNTPVYLYNAETQEVKLADLEQVFYGCTKPVKALLGCTQCVRRGLEDDDCTWKQAHKSETRLLSDALDTLKNRKTKIGRFTYMSPVLTATEHFSKSIRPPSEHDFSMIETASESRSAGSKESQRIKKFTTTACTACPVSTGCGPRTKYSKRYEIQYCRGPYPKDVIDTILSSISSVYTPEQISTLLRVSGPLEKRYNRRKHFATFCTYGDSLRFVLNHASTGAHWVDLHSYKEAAEFMQTYSPTKWKKATEDLKAPTIQKEMLAVLYQMAAYRESPTRVNCWRSTSYRTLYINHGAVYHNSLTLNFTWGRSRNGQLTTPWNLTFRSLSDAYEHYGDLSLSRKTTHELSRRSRYS